MNFNDFVDVLGWALESSKLFNKFPDMILYIDPNGSVINANKKAKDFFKLLSNTNISEIIKDGLANIKLAIKNKKSILVQIRNAEGVFDAELTASRVGNNYCVVLRQNTPFIENKTEVNNIEKFNNEKNIMIHKIEDEIKSPINSIVGFSQGMFDGIAGDLSEKQIKYLKIINTKATELQLFINKFIDFSYCESSLYEISEKKFDIINFLREIANQYNEKFSKINICFTYDNFEDRNIYFDEDILRKSIENIIEASVNMTESGMISIHLSTPDEENSLAFGLDEEKQYLYIIIKDTGIGIPPEEIKHVCNPYAQLEKGKKSLLQSFRLGIASILIKRAGGYISINSDVIKGTSYGIIIPVEKVKNE